VIVMKDIRESERGLEKPEIHV